MKVVLDAGAFIAFERNNRRIAALIALARRANAGLVTSAPALGQVWRDGATQVTLARLLPMVDVRAADLDAAKRAGELLAAAGTADVVDALVTGLLAPGDQMLTTDAGDITHLVATRRVAAVVVAV